MVAGGMGVAGGMLAPSPIGQEDFSPNAQAGNVELPQQMKPSVYGGQPQMSDPSQSVAASQKAMLNKIVIDRMKQSQPDDDQNATIDAYLGAYPQAGNRTVKMSY